MNEERIKPGERVIVTCLGKTVEATCRGDNPKIEGDYWIEFDTPTGWWSYSPLSVKRKNQNER